MSSNPNDIKYFNRSKNKLEIEKVYGGAAIDFLYDNALGKILSPLVTNRYISKAYGLMQDLKTSQMKVPKFIENFNIKMDEYLAGSVKNNDKSLSYKNFNEFFIRRFVDGARTFTDQSDKMGAFAEARYFGYEKVVDELRVPVKGKFLRAKDILDNSEYGEIFKNGPMLIARLCPVDYHRYHYPDSGSTKDSYLIQGKFHSVNPLALKVKSNIFIANERRVSILETKNFGKLAYVEVGAACVGKIVQSFDESTTFSKGDEKGYFLFGGSTVVVIGEEGLWKPSSDILENTKNGIETYIQLGDELGQVIS